jgi:hydrogenase large subunit
MSKRITVDPVTRIEGHLRIDVEVENGIITDAWSSGTMWRGMEEILKGLDPRDAWFYTQRICGVCTSVHAVASVRAVENALDMEIPLNAQYIRNMIVAAHTIHDNIVHFYQLSALDWVDITSALEADPEKAAALITPLSKWHRNSAHELAGVKAKLQEMVDTNQLGIFANGYWGHKEMKLPPEVNLIAVSHYLQALEYQRNATRIVTILGGKNPHIQNIAVGGVANAINLDEASTLNMERLMAVKDLIDKLSGFVEQVYKIDVAIVAAHYPEWLSHGGGVSNYIALPDLPIDGKGRDNLISGGYLELNGSEIVNFRKITDLNDPYLVAGIEESHKHSWYHDDEEPLHPYDGTTKPNYTSHDTDNKYSWVKSPTFNGKPTEVGPIAEVLTMLAGGHKGTEKHLNDILGYVKTLSGIEANLGHLHSTLGRHACRAVRCAVMTDSLPDMWQRLVDNIKSGDTSYFNKPEIKEDVQYKGVGFYEAPRGMLSHWIVIKGGKIENYQCVVPSTWNAAPRNHNDERGPYEQALIGNPIADLEKPLEILRTIHSFDPCMSCAAHIFDVREGAEIAQIKIL